MWLAGLEHRVRRKVKTAGVLVVSHCDSIARADTPRSGSIPLPRRLGAKAIRLCCGDTGADFLRQVVPAIHVLAGADKDGPAERRHPVASPEKLGEVLHAESPSCLSPGQRRLSLREHPRDGRRDETAGAPPHTL